MQKPNYAAMSPGDMLTALGDDAQKWAEAFCQIHGGDEDLMLAWFANAIEHSHDVRTGSGPVVMPDGSAFIVF
ncbi:MAG: hypothetical protein LCH78_18040 [Proteobacteria bacterium]|nr:hypothetical protein [Pseudomonadota bacterium]